MGRFYGLQQVNGHVRPFVDYKRGEPQKFLLEIEYDQHQIIQQIWKTTLNGDRLQSLTGWKGSCMPSGWGQLSVEHQMDEGL